MENTKVRIYRVANGEDLTVDGERDKVNNAFTNKFVHIRNDDGGYFVAVIPGEIDKDFTLMDSSDPEYDELYEWVTQEEFVEKMFDTEITGTIN